jgi:hypothetical protein
VELGLEAYRVGQKEEVGDRQLNIKLTWVSLVGRLIAYLLGIRMVGGTAEGLGFDQA